MDRRKTSVALAHQQSSSMDNGDDNNDSIIDKNEKEFQLSSATCKEIIKSIPQSTTNDAMRTASEKHDEDVPSGSRQGISIVNVNT